MTNVEIRKKIHQCAPYVWSWEIYVNEPSHKKQSFGYMLDESSGNYQVYIIDKNGRPRIRKTTSNEHQALRNLLLLIEEEAELNGHGISNGRNSIDANEKPRCADAKENQQEP